MVDNIEDQVDPSATSDLVQVRFINPNDPLPVITIRYRDNQYYKYLVTNVIFGTVKIQISGGIKYYRLSDICDRIREVMEQMGHFKYELIITHHE